jgi:K(+)-stimulated pyrophosphate-energized sodium pump
LNPLIKVMNLVSLLVLPAIISLRHDDVRFVIAGVCLVVLIVAVLFSKRKSGGFGEESEIVAEAMAEHGLTEGASAGE